MLSRSAQLLQATQPDEAQWLKDRQKALYQLVDGEAATDDEVALIDFFNGVAAHLGTLRTTAEKYFRAADRLVEVRAGLKARCGGLAEAIKNSVR